MKNKPKKKQRIQTKKDYETIFKLNGKDDLELIKIVQDTRKLEIELYWKRATYFWTFLGAILAAYLSLYALDTDKIDSVKMDKLLFLLNSMGLIFSFAWYFVNRGSKYWQVNWEKHMAMIEDKQIGPLFKTTIHKDYYKERWWHLLKPFPFSVSKINHVLNLFFIVLWSMFLCDFLFSNYGKDGSIISWKSIYFISITFITVSTIMGMTLFARTGGLKSNDKTSVNFDKRGVKNSK